MIRKKNVILIALVILMSVCFLNTSLVHAAGGGINWWPLPPYNTLWPLWSPTLSPTNILGIPQPVVSSLTPATVLPVQPGLTWDPNMDYPWLLYNTPLGMVYYDPVFGIDMWPPPYLLDILGNPLPINLSLIVGWSTLAPTKASWLSTNVPVANASYYTSYPQLAPLLSPATLVGLTALVP